MGMKELLGTFISHFICLLQLQTTPPAPETVNLDAPSFIVEIPQGEAEPDADAETETSQTTETLTESLSINSSDPDQIDEESPVSESDNRVTATDSTSASSAEPTEHRRYRRPAPPAIFRGLFKHLTNPIEFVILYSVHPKKPVVSQLILVSYGLGYSAVFVGSCIRRALPRLARILREFGDHALVTVIFSIIALHLPLYFNWMMLLCWFFAVASIRLRYSAPSTD